MALRRGVWEGGNHVAPWVNLARFPHLLRHHSREPHRWPCNTKIREGKWDGTGYELVVVDSLPLGGQSLLGRCLTLNYLARWRSVCPLPRLAASGAL